MPGPWGQVGVFLHVTCPSPPCGEPSAGAGGRLVGAQGAGGAGPGNPEKAAARPPAGWSPAAGLGGGGEGFEFGITHGVFTIT